MSNILSQNLHTLPVGSKVLRSGDCFEIIFKGNEKAIRPCRKKRDNSILLANLDEDRVFSIVETPPAKPVGVLDAISDWLDHENEINNLNLCMAVIISFILGFLLSGLILF